MWHRKTRRPILAILTGFSLKNKTKITPDAPKMNVELQNIGQLKSKEGDTIYFSRFEWFKGQF